MSGSSILIVEDEQQLRSVLVEQIEPLGITVYSAESGEAALDTLPRINVDAVLCDIRMPGMDGLTLLQHVRDRRLELPFVFLTGFAAPEQIQRALRLGAIDFLEKPWATGELIRTVMRALEIGRQMKRLDAKISSVIPNDKEDLADQIKDDRRRLTSLRSRR